MPLPSGRVGGAGPVALPGGRPMIMCGSGNHLGLSDDPRVLAAAHAALAALEIVRAEPWRGRRVL